MPPPADLKTPERAREPAVMVLPVIWSVAPFATEAGLAIVTLTAEGRMRRVWPLVRLRLGMEPSARMALVVMVLAVPVEGTKPVAPRRSAVDEEGVVEECGGEVGVLEIGAPVRLEELMWAVVRMVLTREAEVMVKLLRLAWSRLRLSRTTRQGEGDAGGAGDEHAIVPAEDVGVERSALLGQARRSRVSAAQAAA